MARPTAAEPTAIPRWGWAVVLVPVTALVAVLVVGVLGAHWFPVHDHAFAELRMRDIGTADTPLIGAYSRFGWSHPGPMLTYVLAVPYWLSGRSSDGTLAGAAVLAGVAVAGSVLVAWRRGGPGLAAVTAVVLALLVHGLGAEFLVNPWNPYVPVLFLVLLFLLAWSLSVGDVALLPVAAAVGSFVVQAHVGHALLVAVAAAWGVGWALATRGWSREDRRWWWAGLATAGLLWLPPLVDQVGGSGNLGTLVRWFVAGDGADPAGLGRGLRIAAEELAFRGPWTGARDEAYEVFSGELVGRTAAGVLLPLAALAVAGLAARRWGPVGAGRLLGLAGLLVGASVVSIARIDGSTYDYLVRWTWAVAAFVWLAAGWVLAHAAWRVASAHLDDTTRPRARAAALGAAMVAVAALAVTVPDLTDPPAPEADRAAVVADLAGEVLPRVDDVGGPVLVRPHATTGEEFPAPSGRQLAAGLALQLERAGTPIRVVDQDWVLGPGSGGARMFDDHRAAAGPTAGTLTVASGDGVDEIRIATGDEAADAAAGVLPAGTVEVARVEDAGSRAEIPQLEDELRTTFREAGEPELADAVEGPALGWLFLGTPELAEYGPQVRRLLDLRELPRAAVWWTPTSS